MEIKTGRLREAKLILNHVYLLFNMSKDALFNLPKGYRNVPFLEVCCPTRTVGLRVIQKPGPRDILLDFAGSSQTDELSDLVIDECKKSCRERRNAEEILPPRDLADYRIKKLSTGGYGNVLIGHGQAESMLVSEINSQASKLASTVKPASNGTCMNRNTVHIGKFSWSRELRHNNNNVNLPGYRGTCLTWKWKDILRL